jgi:hypothetical protein
MRERSAVPTAAKITKRYAPRISRRVFLRSVSVIAAGTFIAACRVGRENRPVVDRVDPSISEVKVPASDAAAGVQELPPELSDFLSLSMLLTGVDNLDPAVGTLYLQSLESNPEFTVSVAELIEQAKAGQSALPTTMEALEASQIFEGEGTRTLADKIIEYWYTGVYDTPEGEQALATYMDALAWKTLTFTKPMTVCGTYRFWTEPPEEALD